MTLAPGNGDESPWTEGSGSSSAGLPGQPWRISDFLTFTIFFALTVALLPLSAISLIRLFRPGFQVSELAATGQIILQGLMDLILVGFIVFMVKVVHGRKFRETIHWHRTDFSNGYFVAFGVSLSMTVLIVSSLFPPVGETPIEKLLSSTEALYVLAFFGIAVAPLFEEIIFRGFLFKVFVEVAGINVAIPVTALLFALLHGLQLWGNWAAIVLIFGVGCVLAMVRARTNSLIPGIIVHASYNAMIFAVYAVGAFVQNGIRH